MLFRKRFRPTPISHATCARRWPRKETQMRRSFRTPRPAFAAAGLAALAALAGSAAAPAATDGAGGVTAAHKCLVMTGSGDPAFVKNFNPYTATGLPSGAFV